MTPKNPENFSKIAWMGFEIFRDLYVESMAPIGQGTKTLTRSHYNVAGYSFTAKVREMINEKEIVQFPSTINTV